MKISQVRKLQQGDEVFWNDPDDGACSRVYKISTIDVDPEATDEDTDAVVTIVDQDGSVLECYADELS